FTRLLRQPFVWRAQRGAPLPATLGLYLLAPLFASLDHQHERTPILSHKFALSASRLWPLSSWPAGWPSGDRSLFLVHHSARHASSAHSPSPLEMAHVSVTANRESLVDSLINREF